MILRMEEPDLEKIRDLSERIAAHIDGQNWADESLSETEKNIVKMAVAATYFELVIKPKTVT